MESSTPYRTLEQGEMLNWYRIERILGRGGFGVIYLARDTNLDHDVAIKEYVPGDIARRETDSRVVPVTEEHGEAYDRGLERFISEARNLVRFRHPNIVRVMSVFQENNTAYMVMEFEEGANLREHLANVPLARGEAALKAFVVPIAEGLAEVHRSGFIHRDVKPSNILVRADGSPVLLDFGSARNASNLETRQNLTALVSAGYAPLEQYDDDGAGGRDSQQGPWTDIYALGGVLYHAVSGSDPVDSTRRASAVFNGGRDPLLPATLVGKGSYDDAFLRAIDWALSFRVADRPQTLADWLPALLSGTRPPSAAPLPSFGGEGAGPATVRRESADAPTVLSNHALSVARRAEDTSRAGTSEAPASRARAAPRVSTEAATPEPLASASPAHRLRRGGIWTGAVLAVAGVGWFLSGDARLIALVGSDETSVAPSDPDTAVARASDAPLVVTAPDPARLAGEGNRDEQDGVAEEAPSADEERLAEAASARDAAEARAAEAARLAEQERRADADRKRQAEEERQAEESRLVEEARVEEAEAREAEESRLAEAEKARDAEQAREAEAARLAEAEAARAAEAAEAARAVEREREAARARLAEAARVEAAEAARLADAAREAEQARLAEAARLEAEAEEARVAEEARLADVARAEAREAARVAEAEAAEAALARRRAEAAEARRAIAQRPVSDEEIGEAVERFESLKRAIVARDADAMERLTVGAGENGLFRQLMDKYETLDVSIGNIQVRNADKAIAATLTIKSMVRSNGDRSFPSDAYREREIVTSRDGDSLSPIRW